MKCSRKKAGREGRRNFCSSRRGSRFTNRRRGRIEKSVFFFFFFRLRNSPRKSDARSLRRGSLLRKPSDRDYWVGGTAERRELMEKLKRKTREEGRRSNRREEQRFYSVAITEWSGKWTKRGTERENVKRREGKGGHEEIRDATRDWKGRKGVRAKGRGTLVEENLLVGSR